MAYFNTVIGRRAEPLNQCSACRASELLKASAAAGAAKQADADLARSKKAAEESTAARVAEAWQQGPVLPKASVAAK